MQTARLVQAVVLMMIVAVAASCAAGKEYAGKLFAPRTPVPADSQEVVAQLRFLDLDEAETDKSNWVSTDIITGRDTMSQTAALDKFAEQYPASIAAKTDSSKNEIIAATKKNAEPDSAIAKKESTKKESTKNPAPVEIKPVPEESEPVARTINTEEVRTKRTREK